MIQLKFSKLTVALNMSLTIADETSATVENAAFKI